MTDPNKAPERLTEAALNALDRLTDLWAEEVNIAQTCESLMRSHPDVEHVEALARQCFLEGAYRGRISRADLSLPAELVDQLQALVRLDDEDGLDEPRTTDYIRAINVARRILASVERKG